MILQTITATERRERVTILKLECGHHRSVGGNMIRHSGMVGAAHLMTGMQYPCRDGLCGTLSPCS